MAENLPGYLAYLDDLIDRVSRPLDFSEKVLAALTNEEADIDSTRRTRLRSEFTGIKSLVSELRMQVAGPRIIWEELEQEQDQTRRILLMRKLQTEFRNIDARNAAAEIGNSPLPLRIYAALKTFAEVAKVCKAAINKAQWADLRVLFSTGVALVVGAGLWTKSDEWKIPKLALVTGTTAMAIALGNNLFVSYKLNSKLFQELQGHLKYINNDMDGLTEELEKVEEWLHFMRNLPVGLEKKIQEAEHQMAGN